MIDEREFRKLREQVEENNKMLHKMRRNAIISGIVRTIYFVVVIGIAVSSYYFLQPFVEAGRENARTILESIQNIREAATGISDLSDSFGNILGQ